MMYVHKFFDGKKFHYFLNGILYRSSKRDFNYACVAVSRQHKDSKPFIISLGNKVDSTRNSMAHCYSHYCDLNVVSILKVG